MKHSISDSSAADELGGARARFGALAARWALDAPAAARLLGLDGDWTGRCLIEVVGRLDARSEARMRLACEVDDLLWRLVPDDLIPEWLRTPGVGYADELVTPIAELSTGPAALRALRRYLEGMPAGPRTTIANDR